MSILNIKKILLFFLFLILGVSFLTSSVFAQSNYFSSNESIILPRNEIVDHDYFAAGGKVDILGTVNGDAYIAGGNVTVDGTINGDLLVAGGDIFVNGIITGDLRVAGGNVRVSGEVANNVSAVGGNISIDSKAILGRNIILAAGTGSIFAPVSNDIIAAGGRITLGNNIGGNGQIASGQLDLTREASISGNLDYWSNSKSNIAPSAVGGDISFHKTQIAQKKPQNVGKLLLGIDILTKAISFIMALVIGLLFIWLMPVFSQSAANVVKQKLGMSLLIGILASILLPVLFIVLLITVIGIPLALLFLFGFIAISCFGQIFISLAIGDKINNMRSKKSSQILSFIIGLIVYYIIALIPVIGGIFLIFAWLVGVGALLITKKEYYFSLRQKKLI